MELVDEVPAREFYKQSMFGEEPPEAALRKACKDGDTIEVNYILLRFRFTILVNATREGDRTLRTCLFLAAKAGNTKVLQRLLRSGANPNLCSSEGLAPIDIAIQVPICT